MPRYRRRTGRKRFRRGYNRTSGYYGRFNGKRRKLNGHYMAGEKKFFDLNLDDSSIGTTGANMSTNGVQPNTATICGIPQGTGESQRIGRKCTITNIMIRLNIRFDADTAATLAVSDEATETIRLILFLDKQCNGAVAAGNDLLETNDYNSFRNLANTKRFRTLYDKIIVFNTGAIAEGNGTTKSSARIVKDYEIRINKKVFIPIEFSSTTGALTEIRSNNIAMLIWGKHGLRMNIPLGGVGGPSRIRLRFIDF